APLCICIRSLQDPCPSERCSRVQLDTSSTRFSAVQLPTSLFSPVERFMLFAERKKKPKTHQRSTHDTPLIAEESTSDGVLTVPRYPICRDARKGTAPPPPPHVSLLGDLCGVPWLAGKAGVRRVACRSWWCQLLVVVVRKLIPWDPGTLYYCFFECSYGSLSSRTAV
ncbi:hypothetical protein CSPX01_06445, partial [Colletotrichum filicis]